MFCILTPLLVGNAHAAVSEKFTKEQSEQVEKIIHDYIVKHPDLIMKSVDDFQRASMEQKQQGAIKQNRAALFDDDKSPFMGNPAGDVTIIEFFDYNCHYCKQVFPEIKSLTETDKNLKVIFKDFPILGPTSEVAAKWALAAQAQGKYFPFH